MKTNISVVTVIIILGMMMVTPVASVNATGARMNAIQYRYFETQDSLFTALLTPDYAGGVDVMGWPLTQAEYQTAMNNTGIIVETLPEAYEFELGFNCNWTNHAHLNGRSAMNYTDFRQALACLVDKNGIIAGPILQGFATRTDTQIPLPLMNGYVNPSVSCPNYPWEFNATNALSILYRGGWYNLTAYPSFPDLLSTYSNGTLATYAGTAQGVVYPGADPYGQWERTDTYVNPRAGQPIDALQGYVRDRDARKNMGDMFCTMLGKIGVGYAEHYPPQILPLGWWDVVYVDHAYDFVTVGYIMGAPPDWWYSELTPAGIYDHGPNFYLVDDANMTYWATKSHVDPTQAEYMTDIMNVQDILVNEAYLVSVYTPATYCAYKIGLLGQIDELGYGTQGAGQLMNWITLNSRKNNTIVYNGTPAGTPDSNIIYYGEYNQPDMLNPLFSNGLYDFQVLDEVFTYPFASNPYNNIVPGSAITGWPSGSDLPWMAYSWKTELINDPTNASNPQWTNVTVWFRNDITWHDGAPFTVADVNYTIWANAVYGDAYDNAAMRLCANASDNYKPYFTQWDNWTCSILVSDPSWLSLYTPFYEIIPEHLYRYIVPSNFTAAEQGTATDGLHGLWPGQAATTLLPGAPFTLSTLQNDPGTTWVGTGPWKYREGSVAFTMNGWWGPTLDAYSNFFLTVPIGAVSFKYTWLTAQSSQQPSGGYYKVGLSDLVYLANAYGTDGTPPSTVPINSTPGAAHSWNPAADLAAPSSVIGLSDLTTLALHYGWYYGNYSYNAPYPPSEVANGGP